MGRRINENYINRYNCVVLTQPLAHDKFLKQIYHKAKDKWIISYDSNSVYHVCPFDGVFRNCSECGILDENFNVTICTNKTQAVDIKELYQRVMDCKKSGLQVDFLNIEGDEDE